MSVDEFVHRPMVPSVVGASDGAYSGSGARPTTSQTRDPADAWAQSAREILDAAMHALRDREDFIATVATVARGIDSAALPLLFPIAGHPVELIFKAIKYK